MPNTSKRRAAGIALIVGLLILPPPAGSETPAGKEREQSAGEVEVSSPQAVEAAANAEGDAPDPTCCANCRRRQQGRKQATGSKGPDDSANRGSGCRCMRGSGKAAVSADEGPGRNGCRHRMKGANQGRHALRGHGAGQGRGRTDSGDGYRAAGRQRGMHGRHKAEMETYRSLLENHDSIERTIEVIPGGVRTVTTTSDPELLPTLRLHVSQMKDLIDGGGWIRAWDPLFAEIFERADEITMTIEPVENGVAIVETSDDEAVASLIRAHARKVDEFVARGDDAYQEPTPLPEGYEAPGR